MAAVEFYTMPMSRGQIARWALHEVGADYQHHLIVIDQPRDPVFLALNPMGKVPTIVHHTGEGDHVVTEAAAVCAYLAFAFPDAGLAPTDAERANFFRWLFFAAGSLEAAFTAKGLGVEPAADQVKSIGFGSIPQLTETLDQHFSTHDYVCGSRFTMADVYVGSHTDFGLMTGMLPERAGLRAYVDRVLDRPAYHEARTIDDKLAAQG